MYLCTSAHWLLTFSNSFSLHKPITSNRLDDAELALRDMDKTKKGTLSKQQMYSLMQQNINMTGELKKIKKVVIA